jgi:hypothetical protein
MYDVLFKMLQWNMLSPFWMMMMIMMTWWWLWWWWLGWQWWGWGGGGGGVVGVVVVAVAAAAAVVVVIKISEQYRFSPGSCWSPFLRSKYTLQHSVIKHM